MISIYQSVHNNPLATTSQYLSENIWKSFDMWTTVEETNTEVILAVMNTTYNNRVVKIMPENSGPYAIWTHDLCDTSICSQYLFHPCAKFLVCPMVWKTVHRVCKGNGFYPFHDTFTLLKLKKRTVHRGLLNIWPEPVYNATTDTTITQTNQISQSQFKNKKWLHLGLEVSMGHPVLHSVII